MGIKNLEKMDSKSYETPTEVLELVRTSVIENLQPDFYHSADEHTKSAIELHKKVFEKYPNFYYDIFSDKDFSDYFLDAHKIMAIPYLLQDEGNFEVVKEIISKIAPTRIANVYKICRMKDLFGVEVPKSTLRKLFKYQTEYIEKKFGKKYVGYFGTKYANSLHDLMAEIRVKRKMLSDAWKEVMDWVFEKDSKRGEFKLPALKEARKLRRNVLEKEKPTITSTFPNYVPFTIWEGYARALGFTEKEIFQLYNLMTNNEVKRNLNTLQKYGILEKKKQSIKKRISKVQYDLMDMVTALKVLSSDAYEMLMEKGKKEHEEMVKELSEYLKEKKVSIAVDASGGCAGHTYLLDAEMQKKVANNEPIPHWAKIVQRESFNANVVIAKIIADASKSSKVLMFNDNTVETELPDEFNELIEELKQIEPSGGSGILTATQKALVNNPDIAFVITDLNENVPFQGALKVSLKKIAKKFKGNLIFIVTETVLERPETLQLDKEIKKHQLNNVFIIPAKKVKHIKKGLDLLKLLEKVKNKFKKSKKKKKVEA